MTPLNTTYTLNHNTRRAPHDHPTPQPSESRRAYLITGTAAGFEPLGMVPAAVDLPFLVEVDEVHQELLTHAAHEAVRVPHQAVACP